MNVPHRDEIGTLLERVRRRMWLRALLDSLANGARGSCALLLAGGVIHYAVVPLPLDVGWVTVSAPLVLALAAAIIWRRPSLENAARTADHWFGGKAIMTSAQELVAGDTEPSVSERLVLRRAVDAARAWQARLATEHRSTAPSLGAAFVIMAFAGTVLWLAPGAAVTPLQDTVAVPEASGEEAAKDRGARSTAPLALAYPEAGSLASREPRAAEESSLVGPDSSANGPPPERSFAAESAPTPKLASGSPHPTSSPQAGRGDAPPPLPRERDGERTASGTQAEQLGLSGAAEGPGTDHAVGTEAARRDGDRVAQESVALVFQSVELGRGSGEDALDARKADAGVVLLVSGAEADFSTADPRTLANAERARVAYRAQFSPALQAYASRYLNSMSERDGN